MPKHIKHRFHTSILKTPLLLAYGRRKRKWRKRGRGDVIHTHKKNSHTYAYTQPGMLILTYVFVHIQATNLSITYINVYLLTYTHIYTKIYI